LSGYFRNAPLGEPQYTRLFAPSTTPSMNAAMLARLVHAGQFRCLGLGRERGHRGRFACILGRIAREPAEDFVRGALAVGTHQLADPLADTTQALRLGHARLAAKVGDEAGVISAERGARRVAPDKLLLLSTRPSTAAAIAARLMHVGQPVVLVAVNLASALVSQGSSVVSL
jgi:hypothetical protein